MLMISVNVAVCAAVQPRMNQIIQNVNPRAHLCFVVKVGFVICKCLWQIQLIIACTPNETNNCH